MDLQVDQPPESAKDSMREEEAEKQPKTVPGKTTIDCGDLRRRYDALKVQRSPVESIWAQIERFFMPLGSGGQPNVQMNEGNVAWKRDEVWDSTAIDAAQKLAASIHGSVTSPAIKWFKLGWRDDELKADQESCSWLEDKVGEQVFATLQDSDFNSEIASADQDLVGYGNSFIVEEPASADGAEWKGVDFEAIPIRECYFEADSKGGIDTFYRRLSWTAVQILDMCERRGWKCPDDICELAKRPGSTGQPIELVFCIFEREEREDKKGVFPLAPHLRPVGYVYFRADSGERIGEEGGYYEMPVAYTPWQKTAGSQWGHGPCHILLPTVKYLNAWLETEHMAAVKAVDPTWFVTERGLLSDLNNGPGGVVVVRSKDDIFVLDGKANFASSEHRVTELRAMVQRGLHNDELQLKDSPAMTATEVQARYELMNRVLGSTLARIECGQLSPIVKITIGHLYRARQLDPVPAKVLEKFKAGLADFDIEYQGPLARSQRTDEVAAIERVLSFAGALIKMGYPLPFIRAHIDVGQGIRDVAQRLGTPANLMKPAKEALEAIQQMDAMDARAAQAMTAKTEGEAAQAHAGAAASMAQAQAQGAAQQQGGAPVPAQPAPIISPAYAPVAPFRQPLPPAGV